MIETRAKLTGLSGDDYLRSILPPQQKDMSLSPSDADADEFEADMASFADVTVRSNVYKGSYNSREDIYFDHD